MSKFKMFIGFSAFMLFAGIVGRIDCDVYNGIHYVTGTVVEGKIEAKGKVYSAKGFPEGANTKIKLDGNGNVLSIVVNE